MMGAGKGVSGFSAILGEKREESFKLKRDELQFERQKSLEELRAGNDRSLAEDKRKWADSRQDELLTRQEGGQVKGYDENGMEVTVSQFNAMDPDQQSKVIGKEDYKLKIKTAQQDLDIANKLEMQKRFDDYKYDKAVEQRKIDADNVRKHLADENGYLDPWEELHAQGIEDGQDYVKMVNRGSAWTAEQIKEVNEWLASDETFANIKDPDKRIEYTLKVAQSIFGKKGGKDLGGGKEKQDPVEVLTGLLDSGEETPESMMAEAEASGNPAEIEAATAAINIYKKNNPSEVVEEEEVPAGEERGGWKQSSDWGPLTGILNATEEKKAEARARREKRNASLVRRPPGSSGPSIPTGGF